MAHSLPFHNVGIGLIAVLEQKSNLGGFSGNVVEVGYGTAARSEPRLQRAGVLQPQEEDER
jgi:hypothetical protein